MPDISRDVRAQIWAALAAVILGSGIVVVLAATAVLLGWVMILAGVAIFIPLLLTDRGPAALTKVPRSVARWWRQITTMQVGPLASSRQGEVQVRLHLDNARLIIVPWRGRGPIQENCLVRLIVGDAEYHATYEVEQVTFPDDFRTTDGIDAPAPPLEPGLHEVFIESTTFRMWMDSQGYVRSESVAEPPLGSAAIDVTDEALIASRDEWNSTVRFVVPTQRYPMPHKIVLELWQREGQRAPGPIHCVVSRGDETWTAPEDWVRFDGRSGGEEDAVDGYYVFFPDGFPDAPDVLQDGEYVLRWYERHALGHRLRHEASTFVIRDGEVLT